VNGAGFYNGATNAVTSAPIGANRPAFVVRNAGWPSFIMSSVDLGTAYANQQVLVRFRVGADESTGAPGWDIDNIAFGGLSNTPFASLIGQTTICTTEQQ
jgi:hypothetical protein